MTTGDELSFGRQTSQPCQPDEARDASEDSDGSAELEAQKMLEEALNRSKLAQKSICNQGEKVSISKLIKEQKDDQVETLETRMQKRLYQDREHYQRYWLKN